jgi:hypothetical protein
MAAISAGSRQSVAAPGPPAPAGPAAGAVADKGKDNLLETQKLLFQEKFLKIAVAWDGPALEAVKAYISGSIQPLGSWCCGYQ